MCVVLGLQINPKHQSNAGDLREMQGEMNRAKGATAALLSVGADAKAQGDATSTLCDKLGKEVDGLAEQLGAKNYLYRL